MNAYAKRRGSTVAELCVTMAVIAIAAIMAVSFSVIISSRVKLGKAKADAQNDVDMIEIALEGWMNNVSCESAEFPQITDESELSVNIGGDDFTVSFSDGTFLGYLPNGERVTVHTEQISTVKFSTLVRENHADTLVFCTVTYKLPTVGSDQEKNVSYTFCCNPHVSDVIVGRNG